jgi:hypothetical protein
MTSEVVASANITNLNSVPPVASTPSQGGPVALQAVDGNVTATTGKTSGSVYQLLRLPSNALLKEAKLKLDGGVTTFAGDIGFYYSNSTTDGTTVAHQGTGVNGTTGSQLFGAAVDLHAQTTMLDLMAAIPAADFDLPLWKVCGLTSDPHTPFDLCITNTSTNSGAPVVYGRATYASVP